MLSLKLIGISLPQTGPLVDLGRHLPLANIFCLFVFSYPIAVWICLFVRYYVNWDVQEVRYMVNAVIL